MLATTLTRTQLVTQDDRRLGDDEASRWRDLLERRAAGEPMAYLTGTREFRSLMFEVGPSVLIPRPETELLVELVIGAAAHGAHVIDLGTGSGAIAVAVAAARGDLQVLACDLSADALAVAMRNGERLVPGRIEFHQSDWFAALAGRQFDWVISNPPYIAAHDAHLARGDLRFEPQGALTDGADGLRHLRRLVRDAPDHLLPGGHVAFEHGHDQASEVRRLLDAAGYESIASLRDLAGIERVTTAARPRIPAPRTPADPRASRRRR
ncbi:peptide chain release factor N(5)-glutamine methyltransferase [soil metagenome]